MYTRIIPYDTHAHRFLKNKKHKQNKQNKQKYSISDILKIIFVYIPICNNVITSHSHFLPQLTYSF